MLHEKKILSLRDLAISHLPRVQKNRAVSSRLYGKAFIDSASTGATQMTSNYAESTTVEKLAAELLDLTYMHPDTQAQYPFKRDPIEDAEAIEADMRLMEGVLEVQPQIEAAMLEAAILLCELTGAPLPPWMESNTTPATEQTAGVPRIQNTKWTDAELRTLLDEFNMPDATKTSLGKKHGVTRQRIATLLNVAKERFSSYNKPKNPFDISQLTGLTNNKGGKY